jgi:hypothetical protein
MYSLLFIPLLDDIMIFTLADRSSRIHGADDTIHKVHVHFTITKSSTAPIPMIATPSPALPVPTPAPTPGPLTPIKAWLEPSVQFKDLQVPASCNLWRSFSVVTCFPQLSINQVVILYLANKEGTQDLAWTLADPYMDGVLEVSRDGPTASIGHGSSFYRTPILTAQ